MLETRLAPALTFTVNTLADTPDARPGDGFARDANGNTSLRAAITEGNEWPGQAITIKFQTGLTGTITLGSALDDLDNNFTITGPAAQGITLARSGSAPAFRIFYSRSNTTSSISNLSITGGSLNTGEGGAIRNDGTLTVSACKIYSNTAPNGGGISNEGGTLTVSDCEVYQNTATFNGGGLYSGSGTLNVTSASKVYSNKADLGAGIYNYPGATCSITISSQIYSNTATDSGGGIYNKGTLTMSGGSISANGATNNGGGIDNTGSGTATFTNVSFTGNGADKGGGFYVDGGSITFNTCTISGNLARIGPGGAWKAPGSYTANNCNIADAIVQDT